MAPTAHPAATTLPKQSQGHDALARTDALGCARAAQAAWRATSVRDRCRVFTALRRVLADPARARALAGTVVRDSTAVTLGSEIVPIADACAFLARRAPRILRQTREYGDQPLWLRGVAVTIHRDPLGVVLIIAPSNYPLMLGALQGLFAIAAGNAVLFKPSPGHEACADAFAELLVEVGLPRDLWQVVPSDVPATQRLIAQRVNHIVITGGVGSGRAVLHAAANTLTPVTAELSGCDAVIVRADADLDLALDLLVFGVCINGGATCIGPRRVIVHDAIASDFKQRLADRLKDTTIEPRDAAGRRNVITAVREATEAGATLLVGALTDADNARFPLILTDVPPGSAVLNTDLFAPVMSIIPARDDDHAIAIANDCPYALGANVFTRDRRAAADLAARLDTGFVTINDSLTPTTDPRAPFGGRRDSGFGVARGADGLLAMTQPKVVFDRRGGLMPHRQGLGDADEPVMLELLTSHHARSRWRRLRSLLRLVGLARRRDR